MGKQPKKIARTASGSPGDASHFARVENSDGAAKRMLWPVHFLAGGSVQDILIGRKRRPHDGIVFGDAVKIFEGDGVTVEVHFDVSRKHVFIHVRSVQTFGSVESEIAVSLAQIMSRDNLAGNLPLFLGKNESMAMDKDLLFGRGKNQRSFFKFRPGSLGGKVIRLRVNARVDVLIHF